MNVDNRHLLSRGISKLIFSGLSSDEDDQDDSLAVTLQFVEHNPPVVKTEKAVARAAFQQKEDEKKGGAAPPINPPQKPDVEVDLGDIK